MIDTILLLLLVLACAPAVQFALARYRQSGKASGKQRLDISSTAEKEKAAHAQASPPSPSPSQSQSQSPPPQSPPPFIPTPQPDASLTPSSLDTHAARDHLFANKTVRYPYFQTMAHQPMRAEHWIEPDAHYRADLAYKAALVETQGKVVCDALPCVHEACGEMMLLLAEWLVARYPSLFAWGDGDGGGDASAKREIHNFVTGATLRLYREGDAGGDADGQLKDGTDALRVVSQLVQDDFLIAYPSPAGDGSWMCAGGLVCFPGFYLLSEKIGLSLHDTHAPVPQFNAKLLRSVERSLSRLEPRAPFERTSWEIVEPEDDLFWAPMAGPLPRSEGRNGAVPVPMRETHSTGRREDACQVEDPSKLLLRLDHQTFTKMPKTGAVFFGVHPMRRPLSSLANMPLLPALLLKVHQDSQKDLMDYKAAPLYSGSVVPYLEKLNEEQVQKGLVTRDEAEGQDVGRLFREKAAVAAL